MQEVYLKVFRSIDSFDETRLFLPWLKKIAANTCINYIRDHHNKQHNLPLESIDREITSLIDSLPSHGSLEEEVINRDINQTITFSISELPDNYRIALCLRYLEDMSYNEIADVLKIPLGTVKSNISRGREMLKKRLQKAGLMEV